MTKRHERPLILAGFMATGKTTIGQMLAQHLERPFVDTDSLIVERTGIAIPELFAQYGERFFRTIEKGICHELSTRSEIVVSTGGGALMDVDSRAVMTQYGFVVCLMADEATIDERIRLSEDRPLAPTWRELYRARLPVYESLPHKVDTTSRSPQQITQEILALWFSTST